eukprot:TRINITY_DN9835_c0_g1_i1.p2 TRINITY_DN9835_c0_g1~~TRINITY_DN9835_c0_g1_i1.p2  ORF type:complete len:210 (+),score=59.55 TRINITY_DN9835_c0_g1_i1:44-631(+)
MPTANRFFIGFYDAAEEVRAITQSVVDALGDKMAAVNVYNESKLLGCKFAWMAVREPSHLKDVQDVLGKKHTVYCDVDNSLDETDPTFKQRAFLNLVLARDGSKLNLNSSVVDFLLKDLTGGVQLEARLREVMTAQGAQPLEALVEILSELTSTKITGVTADPVVVSEALRYCDVRRKVAAAKRQQAAEEFAAST